MKLSCCLLWWFCRNNTFSMPHAYTMNSHYLPYAITDFVETNDIHNMSFPFRTIYVCLIPFYTCIWETFCFTIQETHSYRDFLHDPHWQSPMLKPILSALCDIENLSNTFLSPPAIVSPRRNFAKVIRKKGLTLTIWKSLLHAIHRMDLVLDSLYLWSQLTMCSEKFRFHCVVNHTKLHWQPMNSMWIYDDVAQNEFVIRENTCTHG